MEKINKVLKENVEYLKSINNNNPDILYKNISFFKFKLEIIYCESMTDRTTINNFILRGLKIDKDDRPVKNIFKYLTESLPVHKVTEIDNYKDLMYNLLSGFSIILVDGYTKGVAIETKAILNSDISNFKNEKTLKGPKDAFNESYQSNIGLIKKRLKTKNLMIKEFVVGNIGNSKVAVIGINGIMEQKNYNDIAEKIKNINIDAVLDNNQIIEMIGSNEKNFFPSSLETERPDLVTTALLDGKIAIVLENNPYVSIIPTFFEDFFHAPDDLYVKPANASFSRILRMIAFLITILTPAIYIAVTTYNHETIPSKLLINFSTQRDGVPFSTVMEAFLMIITFEIIKETDTRVPASMGNSLSIVGALVLGDAAVSAGIVSPIMVIVVAITSISSLIISFPDVSNGIRWWRIIFIFAATIAGVMGIVFAGFIFTTNMVSISSFGKPFLIPYAPLVKYNVFNGFIFNFKNKFFRRNKSTSINSSKQGEDK